MEKYTIWFFKKFLSSLPFILFPACMFFLPRIVMLGNLRMQRRRRKISERNSSKKKIVLKQGLVARVQRDGYLQLTQSCSKMHSALEANKFYIFMRHGLNLLAYKNIFLTFLDLEIFALKLNCWEWMGESSKFSQVEDISKNNSCIYSICL